MSSHPNISSFTLLLLFLLPCLITSQLIITSAPYDKTSLRISNEYVESLKATIPPKLKDLQYSGMVSVAQGHNINISSFTFDSITFAENISAYANFNLSSIVFAPDQLTLTFDFTYEIDSHGLKNGKLSAKIFYIHIQEQSVTNEITPNVIVEFKENRKTSYTLLSSEETDDLYKQYLIETIKNQFNNKNYKTIQTCFQETINDFINENVQSRQGFPIVGSRALGSLDGEVKMDTFIEFCKDVTGAKENVICFYSGNYASETTLDVESNAYEDESFVKGVSPKNTKMKMFVNKILFEDFIKDAISKKINYDLTNTNKPESFNKTLDITYLAEMFHGVETHGFSMNNLFEVSVELVSAEFEKADILSFKLNTKIRGKNANQEAVEVATLELTGKFEMKVETEIAKVNLCASKINEINVNVIEQITDSYEQDILNQEITKLISACITDGYVCMFESKLNFRDYFKLIEESKIKTYGYYLQGEHI